MQDLYTQIRKDLKHYDLAEVAELSGLTVSALYLWMHGKVESPRTCNLIAVAEVLGYKVTWKR